jgi:hypothetical protein
MKQIQLFLSKKITEESIVDYLDKLTASKWSSSNYDNPESVNFLQYIEYEGDFKLSINLSYTDFNQTSFTDSEIARNLSINFQTAVLVERWAQNVSSNYLVLNEEGKTFFTDIISNHNQIDIDNNTIRDAINVDHLIQFKKILEHALEYKLLRTKEKFYFDLYHVPSDSDILISANHETSMDLFQILILSGSSVANSALPLS